MKKEKVHKFKKDSDCNFTIVDNRELSKKFVKFSFFSCKICGVKKTKFEVLEEFPLEIVVP